MSKKRRYVSTLRVLMKADGKTKREIFKYAPHGLINVFSEAAKSLTNGECKVSKKFLAKHKNTLQKLTEDKISHKRKKKLILQNGGGFLKDIFHKVNNSLMKVFVPIVARSGITR